MKKIRRGLSLLLALCMILSVSVTSQAQEIETVAETKQLSLEDVYVTPTKVRDTSSDPVYRIAFIDCGRKYFSKEELKAYMDNAAAAGFNYVQLGLGNDGLRFLLNDMSLTVDNVTYESDAVKSAIKAANKAANKAYSHEGELSQSDMDELLAYATEKNLSIIPLINTPGHMNAILSCMTTCGVENAAYSGSSRTIDVTNPMAVAFTQALLQKYIEYFAGKVTHFNMGSDEYANDVSDMGFNRLINSGNYAYFIKYINSVSAMIRNAGMTPMAFNDGIYYNYNTPASIDTNIVVCYWSCGWNGYNVASASWLSGKGFSLVNTHGDYYWVLGGKQCTPEQAAQFEMTAFMKSTVEKPVGAMFCIWCDDPDADTAANVIDRSKAALTAFGSAISDLNQPSIDPGNGSPESPYDVTTEEGRKAASELTVGNSVYVTAGEPLVWSSDKDSVVSVTSADATRSIEAETVLLTALSAGRATITAGEKISFAVTTSAAPMVNNREEKTITLSVGETYTDTQEGNNQSNINLESLDTDIATVTVTGTDGTPAVVNYSHNQTVGCSAILNSNATAWTRAKNNAYYEKDGAHYEVYAKRSSSNNRYTYTWGYKDANDAYQEIGDQSVRRRYLSSPNANIRICTVTSVTPESPASTTITFRGVAPGTTTAIVGPVTYTIQVLAENLANVAPLKYEYWITNQQVTPAAMEGIGVHEGSGTNTKGNSYTYKYSELSAAEAYGADGVLLSDYVAPEGKSGGNPCVYWKTRLIASGKKQDTAEGKDLTAREEDGTDFQYVRYYNQSWSVSSDRQSWTPVGSRQVVAYYLQVTEVTQAVTTLVKDWGYIKGQNPGWNFGWSTSWALSFGVVYDTGLEPEENRLINTTVFYNGISGRNIGYVMPKETIGYEVYKITATYGTRSGSNSNSMTVNYNLSTNNTETTVWQEGDSEQPYVDGSEHPDCCVWSGNKSAILIRFYVREVVLEDTLTVRYQLEDGTNFYNLNINVAAGTDFTGFVGPNGTLLKSSIQNAVGNLQTITTDLKNTQALPNMPPKYKSGRYSFTRAELSEDNKILILIYRAGESVKQFVYDFGLPLEIKASDFVDNYNEVVSVSASGPENCSVFVDNNIIVAQVINALSNNETFSVTIGYQGGESETFDIRLVPASNVFYEQNFASYQGSWSSFGETPNNQQLASPGQSGAYQYGYDLVYESNLVNYVESTAAGNYCELLFDGTGITLYTNNDATTGRLAVELRDSTDKLIKLMTVNTIMADGSSSMTTGQNINDTSFPSVAIRGLDHGRYKLVVRHISYKGDLKPIRIDGFRIYNTLGTSSNTAVYSHDGEGSPAYRNLRDTALYGYQVTTVPSESSRYIDEINEVKYYLEQVYDEEENGNNAIAFIETQNIDITDFLNNGPKNQLYLKSGQGITFTMTGDFSGAQLGMKSINGTASVRINGESIQIKSAMDMFYKLSGANNGSTVTISNNSENGAILAITDLKTIGAPATLAQPQTRALDASARSIMLMSEPSVPEQPVEEPGTSEQPDTPEQPTLAEAKLKLVIKNILGREIASYTISAEGADGDTHTFTKKEIQAAVKELALENGCRLSIFNSYKDVKVDFGSGKSVDFIGSSIAKRLITFPFQ